MHNEDSFNGLRVKNLNGDTWTCYGDEKFGIDDNSKTRELLRKALQVCFDEVFAVCENRGNSDGKAALKIIPDLDDFGLSSAANWRALVILNQDGTGRIRESLNDLTCERYEELSRFSTNWVRISALLTSYFVTGLCPVSSTKGHPPIVHP